MLTSESRVTTPKADRYASQLCSHLAHKVTARWAAPEGSAEFPGLGRCRLLTETDALRLIVQAEDPTSLERVQAIVGVHLERFGARDELRVSWSSPVHDSGL